MRLCVGNKARLQPPIQAVIALAPALDGITQELRRQPSGDARILRVMDLRIGAQRTRQPFGETIELLARRRQDVPRQRAREQVELLAPLLDAALPAGELARAKR